MKTGIFVLSVAGIIGGFDLRVAGNIVYSGSQELEVEERSGGMVEIPAFEGLPEANVFRLMDGTERFDGRFFLGVSEENQGVNSITTTPRGFATTVEGNELISGGLDAWFRLGSEFALEESLVAGYDFPEERGQFYLKENAYLGLRMENDPSETVYYGWLRMSHFEDEERFVIHDWAYQSEAGEPILAGEIPEPGAYAMVLGLGVLLFVGVRRRKRGGGVVNRNAVAGVGAAWDERLFSVLNGFTKPIRGERSYWMLRFGAVRNPAGAACSPARARVALRRLRTRG